MKKIFLLLLGLVLPATAFAHAMSGADQRAALAGGNLEYLRLGAVHMLTGYDHLLFLFGVMFFLTKFGEIVKFITAFTLGHCLTLVFATLLHIQANYFLIDAVIALTVCYKAFDNLDGFRKWIGVSSPNLLGAVFLFGLIHGFGLSTRLQQLPLGHDGLVLRILSFNVGVELGQIAALAVMLLALAQWRKTASFARFSAAANVALMLAGALLLLMQLHGFQHTKFPEDLVPHDDEKHHAAEHKAADSVQGHAHSTKVPGSVAEIWQAIATRQDQLAKTLRAKNLDDAHDYAFAIRDLAQALAAQAPAAQKRAADSAAKTIAALAVAIDHTSAADAQDATEANARALDSAIAALKAVFPPSP
jgi:HupE / UreJ protein